MTRDQKEFAYRLGKSAFQSGKPCVPAKDEALMTMVRTVNKFGEGAKLSKAWADGWSAENLKAAIK